MNGSRNGSRINVLAINGSARKAGNTAILLRYVLRELEIEGIETELVELSGMKIHGCLSCRNARPGATASAPRLATWAIP